MESRTEIMKKILFVNSQNKRISETNGGKIGLDRNIKIAKEIFEDNNLMVYNIPYYPSRLISFLYSLGGYLNGLKPNVIKHIREIIKSSGVNYVFLNSSRFGGLAEQLKDLDLKIITFFHNIEVVFFELFLNNSGVFKFLYRPMFAAVKRAEKRAVKNSQKLIVLNKRDAGHLYKIYGHSADFILPLFFYDLYDEARALEFDVNSEHKSLLFIGGNFFGNTRGLFWFIENCLDFINAQLLVVGSGMDVYKNKYPVKNVVFKGYVESLDVYYYQADAVVLPILSGSGMKTKTCEALMYGKTIFGTREAFEGYDAIDFESAGWLCVTKEDFIDKINIYLKSKPSKINKYSRQIYLGNYSDKAVRDIFLKIFE